MLTSCLQRSMTAGQRCITRRNDGEGRDSSYAATGECNSTKRLIDAVDRPKLKPLR
jgi:hypothetical protein